METPSFKEDHISQIPALQMLVNIGYTYLSPAQSERLRGGKTSNVLLEDVLRKQLKQAISQQIRSQQEDGIRSLYVNAQLLLSISCNEALYATNATPEKYGAKWKEGDEFKLNSEKLFEIKNKPLNISVKDQIFADRFKYV